MREGFELRLSEIYYTMPDTCVIHPIIQESSFTAESVRERLGQEIQKIEQLANGCYDACREVYKVLRLRESPELFQAIKQFCLKPLFDQRRDQIQQLLQRTTFTTPEERNLAEQQFLEWLGIVEIRWERRLEIDTFDAEHIEKGEGSLRKGKKPGPGRRLDQRFIDRAGQLRAEFKNDHGRITRDALKGIAIKLDELELEHPEISRPGFCLEKRERIALNEYNMKNAQSKMGAITSWAALFEHGDKIDKNWLGSMCRVLWYCEQHVSSPQ
jgi:hypothetical protein